MRPDYTDILERAGAPLWWDDHGAPRYVRFHPKHCDIYADEVMYELRACQACGKQFKVAFSIVPHIRGGELGDTDPPRHNCELGEVMTMMPRRTISRWVRAAGLGWERADAQ